MEDEFTPIYLALACTTRLHDGFSTVQVDAMSLTTIWALMGIGEQQQADRRKIAQWAAPIPEGGMVPKVKAEP